MEQDKKRVLHIVKIMNHGGAETMIMNLYRNIDRTQVQFDFLCMTAEEGEYNDEIRKLGGRIFTVSSPESGRIKNLKQIYKILKKEKFIAIHSHVSYYSGFICFVAYLAGIKKRITHSHTTNDLRKKNMFRNIYNFFSKFLIKIFSNIKLACGEMAGKYLYGKSKFTVLNNGIDLEKYKSITDEQVNKLKEELNISKDKFVIGHVGRFVDIKNQEYFIELAKSMQKFRNDFVIVLVGQGTDFEKIKKLIKENSLQNYFILPGLREDIPVFMKMFNVFVMPSLYEGFPLVVVEALAGDNICFLSNRISKETNIIESRVNFFDLNADMEELCKSILQKCEPKEKIDIYKVIEDKGFSNDKIAKKIQNIYLKK